MAGVRCYDCRVQPGALRGSLGSIMTVTLRAIISTLFTLTTVLIVCAVVVLFSYQEPELLPPFKWITVFVPTTAGPKEIQVKRGALDERFLVSWPTALKVATVEAAHETGKIQGIA